MKTRNVLLALAAAAAVPAFAFTGNNTCGLVRIESGSANTVIGVPWVEVGTGADVTVAKLVSTANLTEGDELRYYSAGIWYGWTLGASGWEAMTSATETDQLKAPGETETALTRGKALVLIRKGDLTKPFYLYGQYDSTSITSSQALTRGTAENPVYTLLASPKAEAFTLGANAISNPGAGDQIIIYNADGSQTIYTRNDSGAWGRYVEGEPFEIPGFGSFPSSVWETATIPAGQGFWYVSRGNATGDLTVNWN